MIWRLILIFLKVGFLGFGGGYAMLSLIFEESSNLGMTVEQFADLNVLDVLIPGPIAINSATYVGFLFGGFFGSLCATLAVSTPSFVFAPIMIKYEDKIDKNKYLHNILSCVKATSVGLIAAVGMMIWLDTAFGIENFQKILEAKIDWFLVGITIVGWILHDKFKVNPILLTIIAFAVGCLYYYI